MLSNQNCESQVDFIRNKYSKRLTKNPHLLYRNYQFQSEPNRNRTSNHSMQKNETKTYSNTINSARAQRTGKICKNNNKSKRQLNSIAYFLKTHSQQSSRMPKQIQNGTKETYKQQFKDVRMLDLKLGSFAKYQYVDENKSTRVPPKINNEKENFSARIKNYEQASSKKCIENIEMVQRKIKSILQQK